MIKSVFEDTEEFALKFKLIRGDEKPHIYKNIQVRLDHLQEELDETIKAVNDDDLLEVIDGLIDLIYIASGTLGMCGIKSQLHWDEVQRANMTKERGMTKRGHAYDVKKPEGWIAPNHLKILKNYE
jgi:predicted HAD superfamily Cof-like phosphohydrolase